MSWKASTLLLGQIIGIVNVAFIDSSTNITVIVVIAVMQGNKG